MNDDSYLKGRADERRRVASILLNPAAEGRAELAIELAINSMLTVPAAVRTLCEIAGIDAERAAPSATVKRK
jgi:hypothetical protein